jgi:hypothetical protein
MIVPVFLVCKAQRQTRPVGDDNLPSVLVDGACSYEGRDRYLLGSKIGAKCSRLGSPELIAVWKDPEFAPAQRAFYYARVIRGVF